MSLDQFYTKSSIANWCWERLLEALPSVSDKHFIEPSAGDGSFFSLLPHDQRTGIDLDPRGDGIKKADFLKWEPKRLNPDSCVIIGNPPFGKRSTLAIDFFNHGARMADTIAFIVPRQFQKYSVHSKLDTNFRLIKDFDLQEDAFRTPNGKDYRVRCAFQIWTRKETEYRNLRILTPPPTRHRDFEMWQYNNTPQALKVFHEDWEFGVPRQGFEDYTRRETDPHRCERTKQWILFKARTRRILKRLLEFDFERLAMKNTVVPGFGKADVVMEYQRQYES